MNQKYPDNADNISKKEIKSDGIVTEKQEDIKLSDDFKERLLKALKEPSEPFELSN